MGGFSMLDSANVSTMFSTFAIYEGYDKRGAALSQERIVAALRQKLAGVEEAEFAVLVPPPISGLGQSGGFQMMVEDRRSLGLAEMEEGAMELIRAARAQSSLRGVTTSFNARSPQLYLDIDRTKAESLEIPLNNVFNTLQAYLGSAYVNLFNKFNQSYQVYVQAAAPYRLTPEDITALTLTEQAPLDWTFDSVVSAVPPSVVPSPGATGMLEFVWPTAPSFPLTLTYRLNVPAGQSGEKAFLGQGLYRRGAGPELAVGVGPLQSILPRVNHSSDYAPANYEISLSELLRAIQFYNSGGYHYALGTEDDYAPEIGAQDGPPHDADYSPANWAIGMSELLRLIQFYNSGGYHVMEGTEDGFAAGPAK
jgi:hypothetical protein